MKRQPLPVVTSCQDCGACCTGQGALPVSYYLGLVTKEALKLPAALQEELKQMVRHFMATDWPAEDGPCVWYDAATRRCKHYEYRPDICRDGVKVNDAACHRWRQRVGIEPQVRYGIRAGRITGVQK